VAFPIIMVLIAPAIAFVVHRAGPPAGTAHSSLVVAPIERLWRETTNRPLKTFAGYDDFSDGVAFYMPSHPSAPHLLENGVTPAMAERIGRDGIALLCPVQTRLPEAAAHCLNAVTALAARFPQGKRTEIEVTRRYLGVDGAPARYLIFTIPPTP
jgi:hypothetical protein